ncbi:hypothetical protein [Sphingomonas sp. MS122]|uniref:hypothetical protein n=1 Tax=Sphingomonas sp. MS122 TaxID=3412683 RepID=UPI003C2AE1FD
MVQLLSELREPPVVGRFYMVPLVEQFPWGNKVHDWPVLGPMHEDAEFFNFPRPHYHVDVRFIGARLSRWAVRQLPWTRASGDLEYDLAMTASAMPLNRTDMPLPSGRPRLQKRRCFRTAYASPIGDELPGPVLAMCKKYGAPARAICLRDGRRLCPHRKVDLSQFPADENGIVVCPIHGLPVQVESRA